MLACLLCVVFALTALVLWVRLCSLQKGTDEIAEQVGECLDEDTNSLILLSTRNRHTRRLAAQLNIQRKELRRLRRRYEAGDRELKEAVTNVSHDLRTPLTAICGYLELLEWEDISPEARRYLTLIGNRAEAMRQLTEELFRYSVTALGRERLTPEPVDLNGALEEAVSGFYAALTARHIEPVVSLPENRVIRLLDRGALGRVLANLLSNALKYSGGDLYVGLDEEGTVTFSNTAPQLDEITVGRLFDRFFTVEAGCRGTGLGLSIAKTLVEEMGGRMSARYDKGRLVIELIFS